ncbi:MAG: substrate-binding domain-containing protein [Treponema sp.]|nr:substrate-binding domain-containing protein [Treponema sp.]
MLTNKKKVSTVIAVIVSAIILFFPVMFFWIMAAFSDLKLNFLVPAIGVLLVILIGVITFSVTNKVAYKKSIILLSSLIVALYGLIEAENLYKHKYLPSITVGQQSGFYRQYMPFTDSKKLARLDVEPTLHFSKGDELPVVDGATALFPVYCSFVESVYPSDCDIEKVVNFNTTKGSYQNLIKGEDDVIFVAKPSKEQLESAKAAGIEFNMYPIGYEAFVFIVNRKNPVDELSIQQIKDIYTGKIKNWKEVGGKNVSIRPFQRDENSGSQTAFVSLMGKNIELIPPETHQVSGMEGLIDVVSDYQNHSNALGYSFRYYVKNMKKDIGIKILRLNGIEATRENIRNKTYPVTDNFYAITVKGKESENTRKFISWISSSQGQELIEKVGYVSLALED